MGRGAQEQTRQLTDQQLANINALNQQFFGQQQQLGNLLVPQFQSILNNPGLSPADKAAVTGQSQGALGSAFDSLQQSAANRAARTHNSAGFGELEDDLARQKGMRKPGKPSRISSLLPTRHFSGSWQPCKDSPASLVWTPICSPADSAFRQNC